MPGKSPGQKSPVGCSPWCHKESGMAEHTTHTHTQQLLILLFSNARGILMKKISCMLAHEVNLNKFEKIRILQITFYDPTGIKLESVTLRYHEKFQTTLKLNTLTSK